MSKKRGAVAEAAPAPPGVNVSDLVSANYAIKRPYGGGLLGASPRYQIDTNEYAAISTLSEAANEYPALRAIAEWAERNGAPEALLEAWEAAKHGTYWACDQAHPQMPENWKPYRGAK